LDFRNTTAGYSRGARLSSNLSEAAQYRRPIAAALMANASELLAKPPQIEQVDLLAVKLTT
jgi:hypothetical protein